MPAKLIKVTKPDIKRVKELLKRNRIEDVCKATNLSTHTVREIGKGNYDKFIESKLFVSHENVLL